MVQAEYDAVVIGGGAAGLTAAGFAAHLGAKTMLIEAGRPGGDCTWTGCIPSKTLLKAGRVAQRIRTAAKYGLTAGEPDIDFSRVMNHVRNIRGQVYEEADAPPRLEALGIELLQGRAHFCDAHTVEVRRGGRDRRTVRARYFFICTGAGPSVPSIPGLDTVDYLTSNSLFELSSLPQELLVIGGGPVGTEMGQGLSRLGARVTILEQQERILPDEDPELTAILEGILRDEGVMVQTGTTIEAVSRHNGRLRCRVRRASQPQELTADALLVATGRTPHTADLNLDAASVRYSAEGITVNKRCRTNVPHIYACGDVTGRYFLTHMAEHMSKVAVSNALLKLPRSVEAAHASRCTFTDPELAHVGATERQLRRQGVGYEVYRFPFSALDRARTESETDGLIKVLASRWRGKILGASVAGQHAGELICEYALAMRQGIPLRSISDTIHPYPSWGQGARRAADQWYLKKRPRWLLRLGKALFGYRGEIPDETDII